MFWIGFIVVSIALYFWWAYTLYEDMLDECMSVDDMMLEEK